MSKLTLKQLNSKIEFPSTLYSIEFYLELSPADFGQLFQKFRYYCRKENCSFLLVYSTTESKTAKRQRVKTTHKRGRPKKLFWEHLCQVIVIRRLLNLTAQLGNVAYLSKKHLTERLANLYQKLSAKGQAYTQKIMFSIA
jgi:hypothetical protein